MVSTLTFASMVRKESLSSVVVVVVVVSAGFAVSGKISNNNTYVGVTVTVDGRTLFNATESLQNPNFCISLYKAAKLCVQFKNLTVSRHQISGCLSVSGSLLGINVGSAKLGCFTLRIPVPQPQIAAAVEEPRCNLNRIHECMDAQTPCGSPVASECSCWTRALSTCKQSLPCGDPSWDAILVRAGQYQREACKQK